MLTRCSVFVGVSLDGFISRLDGNIDWLHAVETPPGEDFGFKEFMATVDALVMGRNTFEQVLTFGEWPYGSTPVIVLSQRLESLPSDVPQTVSLTGEEPAALVERLSGEGQQHLYVDGGRTVQSFLAANLIDELIITTVPVLIGTGRRLFGPLPGDVRVEHVSTQVFDRGFVQNRYRVVES